MHDAGGVAPDHGRRRDGGLARGLWTAPALVAISCTSVLDYGPPRTARSHILYRQSAEATSGAGLCGAEEPALEARAPDILTADCDSVHEPLEGAQSIRISNEGFVACDPCWAPTSTLWSTFAFRVEHAQNFIVVAFEFAGDDPKSKTLSRRATGTALAWGWDKSGPDPKFRLYCSEGTFSEPVPTEVGVTHRLVMHFDWSVARGELWIGDAATDPLVLVTTPPSIEIACSPQPYLPVSWDARAMVKPSPGHGSFSLDDVRVATTQEGLAL